MNAIKTQNRRLEAIAWGSLLIWWGITELVTVLPEGTGLIGIGLILIGLDLARWSKDIPASGFSTSLGILALVWGGLELAGVVLSLPFEIPVFAILLIVLGSIILAPELTGRQNQ